MLDIHDRVAVLEARVAALEAEARSARNTPNGPTYTAIVEAEKNPMDKPKNRVSAKG